MIAAAAQTAPSVSAMSLYGDSSLLVAGEVLRVQPRDVVARGVGSRVVCRVLRVLGPSMPTAHHVHCALAPGNIMRSVKRLINS